MAEMAIQELLDHLALLASLDPLDPLAPLDLKELMVFQDLMAFLVMMERREQM